MSNQQLDLSPLNPYEAFSLHGDSPQMRDYLASLLHYTTDWDRGHVETRKMVYALMTNIQTLTVSVHGYVRQDFYLRPSIKAISMNFNLSFVGSFHCQIIYHAH